MLSFWNSAVYNIVWCQYKMILQTSLQLLRQNSFEHTKDTPYFALTGKLQSVHCEDFEEN